LDAAQYVINLPEGFTVDDDTTRCYFWVGFMRESDEICKGEPGNKFRFAKAIDPTA
jgi:hypothetical protein